MGPELQFTYDAATAISQGRRERQEDAVASDFMAGAGLGFAVLADGMGGHAAGDIASKIVVTEVFSELKFRADAPQQLEAQITQALSAAARAANDCVGHYAAQNASADGMGATLLAPVLFQDRLYWISVGDSPLYLFRDGELMRLNDEHSLAAQLDARVTQGLMSLEQAHNHPDRACLTSVLSGQDIARIDCRSTAFTLRHRDIVIAASDGLQYLEDSMIAEVLTARQDQSSSDISAALMGCLHHLNDPEQDNISFCVIKVSDQLKAATPQAQPAKPPIQPQASKPKSNTITIMASASRSKGITSFHIVNGDSA
ncbi:PP2C family protein-serine/threonine phosphatase [Parasedimentitalea psychrophila]|uniref:Protein phosphatase 2C domain-containing protein n=1 Tax=Parasedimentitalea psychrophila TaxID=2997337 RepID=A0A9Y2L1W3_9RHOB|nr:protein phosphatase 2C domain-containing protein [Parasedimentitalea psychrophila]WIY25852.1 protein phosphatase 2C domain-containing protein [Parasedimentitalea psychrophila]